MRSKIISIVLFATVLFASLNASAKKDKPFVDGTYSRNSISIVVVNHGDKYDNVIQEIVNAYKNDKFDYNDIDIKVVNSRLPRLIDPKIKYSNGAYIKPMYSQKEIESLVEDMDFGKSIFSYWFNRTPDGKMDDQRVLERGRYNATDQDVKNAMATEIGKGNVAEMGYGLISRSYVIILDVYAAGDYSIEYKDGKKENHSGCSASAVIYALDISDNIVDGIFEKGWIYDGDDTKTINKKMAYYEKVKIPVKERLVVNEESVEVLSLENKTFEECLNDVIDNILDNNKMTEWKVASPIINNHPIESKIGKKEGVKNGMRFSIYTYKENKEGELKSKRVGYVRAANKIVDNRIESDGNTKPTQFYQISGLPLKSGYTLVEKKDTKTKLDLGLIIYNKRKSSKIGVGIGCDIGLHHLAYLNTFAGSRFAAFHYAIADYSIGPNTLTLGYGCGLRLIRMLEFEPYFKIGLGFKNQKHPDPTRFGVSGGIALNLQIAAPFDFFFRIGGNGCAQKGERLDCVFGFRIAF